MEAERSGRPLHMCLISLAAWSRHLGEARQAAESDQTALCLKKKFLSSICWLLATLEGRVVEGSEEEEVVGQRRGEE